MTQIEENKKELMELMEKFGNDELSPTTIENLHECWGAYNALCMISETHQHQHGEHTGDQRESMKTTPTTAAR